uniref:DUF3741 domain-containing protein n=1 Tax=Ananas comosus var. bracteatus TaxID=296719 RepID=A0A6V7PQU7_ANACO|nr:unnamed protein product [Ananas comosus var. bracteatus]
MFKTAASLSLRISRKHINSNSFCFVHGCENFWGKRDAKRDGKREEDDANVFVPARGRVRSRPLHQQASIGCISGIFHFFSRHHSHPRKRLTPASKKENAVISPLKRNEAEHEDGKKRDAYLAVTAPSSAAEIRRRRSCDAPRSPTIPAEIRRSCSAAASPRGAAPALVARLMGLDAPPPTSPQPPRSPPIAPPETAAEKRRKLLGALERCDEDLKALRRIIEAVRSAEMRVKALGAADRTVGIRGWRGGSGGGRGRGSSRALIRCSTRSRRLGFDPKGWTNTTRKSAGAATTTVGSRIVKPSRMGVAFSGNHNMEPRGIIHRPTTIEGLPSMYKGAKAFDDFGAERISAGTDVGGRRLQWRRRRRSLAMAQSVDEVWEEGVWEEKWELGRMVVGLEWDILECLVEDVVLELLLSHDQCVWNFSLMPLRRCRKSYEYSERSILLPNGEIVGEVTKSYTFLYKINKREIDGLFAKESLNP